MIVKVVNAVGCSDATGSDKEQRQANLSIRIIIVGGRLQHAGSSDRINTSSGTVSCCRFGRELQFQRNECGSGIFVNWP